MGRRGSRKDSGSEMQLAISVYDAQGSMESFHRAEQTARANTEVKAPRWQTARANTEVKAPRWQLAKKAARKTVYGALKRRLATFAPKKQGCDANDHQNDNSLKATFGESLVPKPVPISQLKQQPSPPPSPPAVAQSKAAARLRQLIDQECQATRLEAAEQLQRDFPIPTIPSGVPGTICAPRWQRFHSQSTRGTISSNGDYSDITDHVWEASEEELNTRRLAATHQLERENAITNSTPVTSGTPRTFNTQSTNSHSHGIYSDTSEGVVDASGHDLDASDDSGVGDNESSKAMEDDDSITVKAIELLLMSATDLNQQLFKEWGCDLKRICCHWSGSGNNTAQLTYDQTSSIMLPTIRRSENTFSTWSTNVRSDTSSADTTTDSFMHLSR